MLERRAPNDRIFNDNHTFSLKDAAYGIELDAYLGRATVLTRCDECTTDVMVAD